ncbi:YhhN-domain-containing protein [Basidiobolus meristosporus CBS 931.73]|uniref:YhhN-domain-containing protein n=1 Tax=Basidiobolus meristosporus CBS 931.73 TaxID=1314790 RepID=A0A1Y1YE34_9FUNG|nr:YhhN-domain-containing protein [Basidiobolus meristosporus CBS 931.73]|eukprot:ORX96267.1 YhhN-domain-containing protein [Basidiobolus meristosporus CBS 931.73]
MRLFYFSFFASAAVYLGYLLTLPEFLVEDKPYSIPVELSALLKALPIISLACFCQTSYASPCINSLRNFVTFGLFASALGDVFLELDNDKYFVHGLGSFLLGHLFYIGVFSVSSVPGCRPVSRGKKLFSGVILASFYVSIFFNILLPNLRKTGREDFIFPVAFYALVIVGMTWCAYIRGESRGFVGAGMFVISDFLLAWNKFVQPISYGHRYVMATYYMAQLLITLSSTISISEYVQKTGGKTIDAQKTPTKSEKVKKRRTRIA